MFTNTKTDVINHQNILSAKHQPKIVGMLGNNSLNVTSQSFNMKTASVGLGEKSQSLKHTELRSRQSNVNLNQTELSEHMGEK